MIDFSIVAARHLLLFYALHYPEAQTKKTGRTVTKKTQQFHLKLMICLPLKLNTVRVQQRLQIPNVGL